MSYSDNSPLITSLLGIKQWYSYLIWLKFKLIILPFVLFSGKVEKKIKKTIIAHSKNMNSTDENLIYTEHLKDNFLLMGIINDRVRDKGNVL